MTQAARSRRFRERHPDRARAHTQAGYERRRAADLEGERAKGRERDTRRNAERVRARRAAWRERNRDELRAYARAHYVQHRDAALSRNSRRRAIVRGARVAGKAVDRAVVLAAHDDCCGICGFPVDPRDWHLDHIWPLAVGGWHDYDNVQPAHPLCNLSKGTGWILNGAVEALLVG